MNGRRIFYPLLVKAHSKSMDTTVRDSRDPARAKVVTVSPGGLFPTDV